MNSCLLLMSLTAGGDPTGYPPRPPNWRPVPAPASSAFVLPSTTPAVSPIPLGGSGLPSWPNLADLPLGLDLSVKQCERVPGIAGAWLADAVGRPHRWLVVEDTRGNILHAPGLGNKRGVPGADGKSSPDWPLSRTYIRDHSAEIPRACDPLPRVDPLCVIAKTPYNRYEGRWTPFANDCNSFVRRTITSCGLPALPPSPLLNSPQLPKYRLGDFEFPKSTLTPPVLAPGATSAPAGWHPPLALPGGGRLPAVPTPAAPGKPKAGR